LNVVKEKYKLNPDINIRNELIAVTKLDYSNNFRKFMDSLKSELLFLITNSQHVRLQIFLEEVSGVIKNKTFIDKEDVDNAIIKSIDPLLLKATLENTLLYKK